MKGILVFIFLGLFALSANARVEHFPSCIDGYETAEVQKKLFQGDFSVSVDWSENSQSKILSFVRDVEFRHIEMSGLPMNYDGNIVLKFKIRKLEDLPRVNMILSAEKELYSFFGLEGAKVHCNFPLSAEASTLPSDTMIPFY